MTDPLISIALCTFNGERFIAQQLNSLIKQTYQNIEIIIVDDHSTDNTFNILGDIARQDLRIKLFRNEVNIGFNKNFEKAISLSTGAYIAISDQDDIWSPEKIATLVENISDNWLIFSNSACIDDQGNDLGYELLHKFNFNGRSYKSLLLNNWVTGHTVLFKKELTAYIMPLPDNGYYDWWMGFVAAYHDKITYLDRVLTFYRIHSQSVTQQEQNIKKKPYKLKWLDILLMMLNTFRKYKGLTSDDEVLISKLYNAVLLKKTALISLPLLNIIYNSYYDFFPDVKYRGFFSKFNFAFKHAKGIKMY